MILKSLEITNLYHFYSYKIAFDNKTCSEPFIITGVNGTGKTTIFRILNSISTLDLTYFLKIPFEQIKIYFDKNTSLVITQKIVCSDKTVNGDTEISKNYKVSFELKDENRTLNELSFDEEEISKTGKSIKFISFLKNSVLPIDSIIERLANDKNQSQMLMILRGFKVTFIEAQRIAKRNENSETPTSEFVIDNLANDLKKKLRNASHSYLQEANRIDSLFIDRLLTSSANYNCTKEEYEKKAESIRTKLKKIRNFGFEGNLKIHKYDSEKSNILKIYLDGVEEKIKAYDDILGKLELFSELLDTKHFMHKKLSFSQTAGIKLTTDDGVVLDLSSLSSGEQNEIIMLYYMIFVLQDNSVLLIDEPEISLHVAWQVDYIKEIEKIAQLKNVQVVIATHSPQIINDNWNICYDLGQNNSNEN